MASATAATASSVDPLTFQSIPPTLESQEVISTLHQYFNQSEMPQLGEGNNLRIVQKQEVISKYHLLDKNSLLKCCVLIFADNAWIDPAVAAAAAVAHHPGLSADPYHPDYGIGR